jgi:hypothetical protein
MQSRDIVRSAEQASIARRTLFRAKRRLGVEANRVGGLGSSGKWFWTLPTKGASVSDAAPLEETPVNTADFSGQSTKSATQQRLAPLRASRNDGDGNEQF